MPFSFFKSAGRRLTLPVVYALSGVFFTIFGATIYWTLYPLGPFLSILITEATVHTVRYLTFRYLVFTSYRGFVVNPFRYIIVVIPASLVAFISVILFSPLLGRAASTVFVVSISFVVGFFWGKRVFTDSQ